MRTPNDLKLAEQCNEIDLILGGHDHVYETHLVGDPIQSELNFLFYFYMHVLKISILGQRKICDKKRCRF